MTLEPKHKRIILFLADGARSDVFESLLQKGELPHIQKELVQKGTFAKGITTFPSTTGPAYFPFVTGCFPGTLNVPGIRWFDKQAYANPTKKMVKFRSYCGIETFLINKDMTPRGVKPRQTVFEILPHSYNIFNAVCRGAGWRNLTKIMRIWYWYYAHLTDRWEFLDQVALKKTLGALDKDFDFLFVVLPGIDEYSHLVSPFSPKAITQYHFLDNAVGEVVAKLKNQNRWEETLFWIVSDHGLSETKTHFCVNTFLEEKDWPPFYYPKVMHRKGKRAANMMSGNGMTHLYFKNGKDWGSPTYREDLEKMDASVLKALQKHPAVDILAMKNKRGGVDILSKRGEAKLFCEGDKLRYQVLESDPFGYGSIPSLLNREIALEATWQSDYPDALWQLEFLFRSSRTGDVVLSATPGFDFRLKYEEPEHHGSHGSLHKEHMLVPIVVNYPLHPKVFRTVDIFPTMLKLLGKEVPKEIDGLSLVA